MIINMWWFYLINVIDNIGIVSLFASIISFVCLIGYLWFMFYENKEVNRKFVKKMSIIFTVSIFSLSVIPSRETMYTMMISNVATYENIDSVFEIIQNSVDYIFEKLD